MSDFLPIEAYENLVKAAESDHEAKFTKGKPADPTSNMSPEQAAEWKKQNDEHRDKFKSATDEDETDAEGKFEKGKPADPTKDMSNEDKAKWEDQKDKHKDQFKAAASDDRDAESHEDKAESDRAKEATSMGELNGLLRDMQKALDKHKKKPSKQELQTVQTLGVDVMSHGAVSKAQKAKAEKIIGQAVAVKMASGFQRQRLSWDMDRTAASGLYGFTKATQRDVEASIRKIQKQADKIAKAAWGRDDRVASFLGSHAKRANSLSAKILVAALKNVGPKVASETDKTATDKEANFGCYGYSCKTATLGLNACSELRGFAGRTAYGLHSRRQAKHERITGFLNAHCKSARCRVSKLMLSTYPDRPEDKVASTPSSVDDWLAWE